MPHSWLLHHTQPGPPVPTATSKPTSNIATARNTAWTTNPLPTWIPPTIITMLALQRNSQALRMVSITPPSPLVINAARARFVVIVSNLNVPIAEDPELPAASPTRANGSTIRRSCKPSFTSFASLTVFGHIRTSRLILHRVDNVDVLGKRMDKFEAAIVKCVNAVEQHISITNTSLQSAKARLPDEESAVLETIRNSGTVG